MFGFFFCVFVCAFAHLRGQVPLFGATLLLTFDSKVCVCDVGVDCVCAFSYFILLLHLLSFVSVVVNFLMFRGSRRRFIEREKVIAEFESI